jgi:hypothetical protein
MLRTDLKKEVTLSLDPRLPLRVARTTLKLKSNPGAKDFEEGLKPLKIKKKAFSLDGRF